jgi:hypothetical protein
MSELSSSYNWLTDPSYLPSLAEVQEAEKTPEGKEAIHAYYRGGPVAERFEIWTEEYIAGLSKYIVRRLVHYDNPGGIVLEVGAGDGRLSGLLRQKITSQGLEASVVATDIEPPRETHFPVEAESYDEALEKHEPTIAISSWMPLNEEWTWAMRATPSLQDYILIGAPKLTGNISTWGGYTSPEIGEFAPIDLHHLDELKAGQFSGHDIEVPYLSLTRGFRRYTKAHAEPAQHPIR